MSGKPKIPYTDLVSAYRELGTAKAVAERYNISDQSVYTALKQLNESSNKHTKRLVSDEEIIAAYKRLGDGNKVAKALHTNAVYSVLKKHNIAADGHKKYIERVRKIGSDEINNVISNYTAGKSAAQIANEFNCTTETILKVLRRGNIIIRSSKPRVVEEEHAEIKRLYESGLTLAKVAKIVGRSENTIQQIINNKFAHISRSGKIGPDGPHWLGGRTTQGGYPMIWINPDDEFYIMAQKGGYVYEHRLVLARKLGRALQSSETVHHIDGNKQNNHPDNLQLRQGTHGKHVVMRCLDCGSQNVGHVRI